eukprot:symbB.v1.2.008413.t1/scaffold528.1/size191705/4
MPAPCLPCFRRQEEDAPPSDTIRVKIVREDGAQLGFLVAYHANVSGLVIQEVRQESIAADQWNYQHPWTPMEIGQAIVRINGENGIEEMMAHLRHANVLDMLVSTRLTPSQRWTLLESSKRSFVLVLNLNIFRGNAKNTGVEWSRIDAALDKMRMTPEACDDCQCSICFDEMDNSAVEHVKLPCNHSYHRHCVQKWLMQGKGFRCPLCNQPVDLDG